MERAHGEQKAEIFNVVDDNGDLYDADFRMLLATIKGHLDSY